MGIVSGHTAGECQAWNAERSRPLGVGADARPMVRIPCCPGAETAVFFG